MYNIYTRTEAMAIFNFGCIDVCFNQLPLHDLLAFSPTPLLYQRDLAQQMPYPASAQGMASGSCQRTVSQDERQL